MLKNILLIIFKGGKMRKVFLISIFLIVLLSLTAISAADNGTEVETQSSDIEPVLAGKTVNVVGDKFSDIQKKIDKAKDNYTVILNGTYKGSGSPIYITKDLTIEGSPSATLDATSQSSIFRISGSKVTLKNLKLINANSDQAGGAIYSYGTLIILNCTFKNNSVKHLEDSPDGEGYGNGGAIYSTGQLVIKDSKFIKNKAYVQESRRDMDRYVSSDGSCGGAIYSKGILSLDNSKFSLNRGGLGTVYLCGDGNITNSIFDSEYVKVDDFKELNVINSSFKNCYGALMLSYGDEMPGKDEQSAVLIDSCNFTDNEASITEFYTFSNITLVNCMFKNNEEGYRTYSGYTSIINSSFINESGLYVLDLFMDNCRFINNSDAIRYSTGNIFNCDFINNTFDDYFSQKGGVIFIENYSNESTVYSMINCSFINNRAKLGVMSLNFGYGKYSMILDNCTFEDNCYILEHISLLRSSINLIIKNSSDVLNFTISGKNKDRFFDSSWNVIPVLIEADVDKSVNTTYNSDETMTIKVKYINGDVAKKEIVWLYFYNYDTGCTYKYDVETNSKGIAKFKFSQLSYGKRLILPVGKNELTFIGINGLTANGLDDGNYSIINIKKATTTIKAPKVVNKFKKSKYFKITVKSNKKAVKKLELKLKVFTGKKYKTYTVTTNKNGLAKFNTKSLKAGKHKVVISSGNPNYTVSAKSQITIKK